MITWLTQLGWLEWTFAAAAGTVLYAYVGYPVVIALLARVFGRPVRDSEGYRPTVSVVMAVHNEEQNIARRIKEYSTAFAGCGISGEIIIVSDGSTDGTVAAANACASDQVRILAREQNEGKAVALTAGCAAASGDILVFADARQRWDAEALPALLEPFGDPAVGAVSGELILESAPGVMAGVGLYWKMEKWIRKQESCFDSTVGVTGAIAAVRRSLFRPVPRGLMLDDVYWPLQVVAQGYRVVFEPAAKAFDRLPPRAADEFRRKVRTLSGNYQLLWELPSALLPWRNRVWFQLISHKVLRLLVPWLCLLLLVLSAVGENWFFLSTLLLQVLGYILAVIGLVRPIAARSRLASAGASFLVLNAAAWLSFWVWLTGRTSRSWKRVEYANRGGDHLPLPARDGTPNEASTVTPQTDQVA